VKKSIRLIAVDLDGTLLDSSSRVSRKNKKAVRECLKRGIKVVLSTGKSTTFVKGVIEELGLPDPQVVYGGAAIIDKDLKILTALRIPEKSYIEAIEIARRWKKGCAIGTADGVFYYEKENPYLMNIVEAGDPLVKTEDLTAEKIVDNALLLTIIIEEQDGFNDFIESNIRDDVKIRRAGSCFLNILNRQAGKLFGVKKIMEFTGIKKSEVMAIGDSDNDLGIIKFAATGIAMLNSPEKIKQAADFVVGSNDDDGVAEAIYRYVEL
jgi:Cof subfamily protein (haloacid dehalogenase superfamily)